jgi:hypothetical protein
MVIEGEVGGIGSGHFWEKGGRVSNDNPCCGTMNVGMYAVQ